MVDINEMGEQMGWLVPKRVTGFEPVTIAWKATVLPLNYTRWRRCEIIYSRTQVTAMAVKPLLVRPY